MKRAKKPELPVPLPRETLEEAVARVAADYARFVALGAAAVDDPKLFAAHHAAAKSALAHLQAIRELAGGEPGEGEPPVDVLAAAREGMAEEAGA